MAVITSEPSQTQHTAPTSASIMVREDEDVKMKRVSSAKVPEDEDVKMKVSAVKEHEDEDVKVKMLSAAMVHEDEDLKVKNVSVVLVAVAKLSIVSTSDHILRGVQ